MMAGGFGETKEATEAEQEILNIVKTDVEQKLGKGPFAEFKAIVFQTQVVAGVNYLFKVKCDDEFIHVKVCKPLPHTNQPPFVMAVEGSHSLDSTLAPL